MARKALSLFFSVLLFLSLALACGGVYKASTSNLSVEDQVVAVGYDHREEMETLVVSPSFSGRASDFGYVMPTPSRPEIEVRHENFFRDLEGLAKPEETRSVLDFLTPIGAASSGSGLNVVEKGSIGNYKYSILKANSSAELINWLHENDYMVQNVTEENIEYYVEKDDYYFSAFKFDNISEDNCLTKKQAELKEQHPRLARRNLLRVRFPDVFEKEAGTCYLASSMQPIEFRFKADKPLIPARIMKGQYMHKTSNTTDFRVFTSSKTPMVVPGARVRYSGIVKGDEGLTDLERTFMVEQDFSLDTKKVSKDIYLESVEPFYTNSQRVKIRGGEPFIKNNETELRELDVKETERGLSNIELKLRDTVAEIPVFSGPGTFLVNFLTYLIFLPGLLIVLPVITLSMAVFAPALGLWLVLHLWWSLRTWKSSEAVKGVFLTTFPALGILLIGNGSWPTILFGSAALSMIISLFVALIRGSGLLKLAQSWERIYSSTNRKILLFNLLAIPVALLSKIEMSVLLIIPFFQAASLIYCWRKGLRENLYTEKHLDKRLLAAVYICTALLFALIPL